MSSVRKSGVRNIRRILILSGCAASVVLYGALLAETRSLAQNSSASNPNPQGQDTVQGTQQQNQGEAQTKDSKKEHLKKLSGKLVDAPCMEKGLASEGNRSSNEESPQTGSQNASAGTLAGARFLGSPGQAGQAGQTPGQNPPVGPNQTPGTQPGQTPRYPQEQYPNQAPMGPTPAEKQARVCPATSATTSFGLVLSDGKFVVLDGDGNTKAGEAVKATTLKQGKAPKAQVRGTLEGATVRVSEIRVKA
jgi:hypothetical protein